MGPTLRSFAAPIDCDDGDAHTGVALRTAVAPQALQFFLDHPYG